jgi:hypothetical protein
MENQNITLSLPKELFYRAKRVALERRTSVSGLLACALEQIVADEEGYEAARQWHLNLLAYGADLGTEGITSWRCEDLHER